MKYEQPQPAHPAPEDVIEARAAIAAQAREAFECDLERKHQTAEFTDELSNASSDMKMQAQRREALLKEMLESNAPDADGDPPT